MTALDELTTFRADRPTRKPRGKEPWRPLTPDRLRPGVVLAFDQTIRNAGWALIVSDAQGVRVELAGTCTTKPDGVVGWEGNLSAALVQAQQIAQVVALRCEHGLGESRGVEIVHEAPPTGGGKKMRPESSALAALGVRVAAAAWGRPVTMLSNHSMKRLLFDVGDGPGQIKVGSIDKAMVGRAVADLDWLVGRELLTNEHKRDAGALALLRMTQGVG